MFRTCRIPITGRSVIGTIFIGRYTYRYIVGILQVQGEFFARASRFYAVIENHSFF